MTEPRLRLMATPGDGLTRLLKTSRDLLAGVSRPRVGYLPAAAMGDDYLDLNRAAFTEFAEIELLDTVGMDMGSIQRVLDRASLLYVPGGNTFVLAARLRKIGLVTELAQRVRNGLPWVGCSAGAVLCGLDILNSNDSNAIGCRDFDGLGLLPFSLNVHYPPDSSHAERDERIAAYQLFHQRPVLALEDDALLRVDGSKVSLTEGRAWLFDGSGRRMPFR